MELSSTYIYERMPLVLLFATGYILYRVIASAGLPEHFASAATRFSRGRTDLLLLSLIVVSAALSMFIPNAVTVLAMIPVIRKLNHEIGSLTTPLTLSIIYGANIGGMGSLIGSPANLLLIGALDFFNVPGRNQITFFNWFLWALPLVTLFLLLAWAVLRYAIPKEAISLSSKHRQEVMSLTPKQKRSVKAFSLFILFWSVSSVLREFSSIYREYEYLAAILFALFFVVVVFGGELLKGRELIQGVPVRGLMFLGLLGALIVIVRMLRLDEYAAQGFTILMSYLETGGQGGYTLYLVTALVVILLTEVLSNTVVSTAFFAVIVHAASIYAVNPLPLMVLVSAASTCAFMTPVATPCNSLAVGEMRGISFRTMVFLGVILNLLGSFLLSFWIWKVVPLVYH